MIPRYGREDMAEMVYELRLKVDAARLRGGRVLVGANTLLAAAFTAPEGRRVRARKKPKAVDKAKRAKRRTTKASRKRNRG